MDAKITKQRLGLLLSYDWIKIIGICAAAVLVWALLFTTMATRATTSKRSTRATKTTCFPTTF